MNWQLISLLGDSMLILPSAILVFSSLYSDSTDKEIAWHWAVIFCSTCFIVCISKIAFMGWGIGNYNLDFTGISGHAALSSCFFPVFFWLLSNRFSVYVSCLMICVSIVLVLIIGYSRLMVHAHSISEVLSGLMIGILFSTIFLVLHGASRVHLYYKNIVAMLIIQFSILITGASLPTESLLEKFVVAFSHQKKVYTRVDLNKASSFNHAN